MAHSNEERRQRRAVTAAVVLILLSFMYQSHLVPGFVSHVAQGLAVVLSPLGRWRNELVRRATHYCTVFALISLVCILPAFLDFGVSGRFPLAFDVIANTWLFLCTFALLMQAGPRYASALRAIGWITVVGSVLQVAAHPVTVASDSTRIAGVPRPLFTFSEPTWLGVTCSLLIAALLTLGSDRLLVAALGCIDVFIFTRTAIVLLVVAVYFRIRGRREATRALETPVLLTGVMAAATYFTVSALLAPVNFRYVGTSLSTRLGDITAVRVANNDDLLPFGGSQLSIFDPTRNRAIPSTSNNVAFDLLWKFGIGGVIIVVLWAVLLAFQLPRVADTTPLRFAQLPAGAVVILLPAAAQLNNMFREPWIWCLSAVLLATVVGRLSSGGLTAHDEPSRIRKSRRGALPAARTRPAGRLPARAGVTA